ncbi:MAG: imidazolonepropionase [Candidatus Eremiobacter antarcticus]|nr:imidazolonepropionase [Candidatus Eremiobacteraeota bacterium]MBC5808678.1 imidazolonepropionase [Candidatus Eremiobacteraeota bacterium]
MVARPGNSYAIHNATLLTLAPLSRLGAAKPHVSEEDLGICAGCSVVVEQGVIASTGSYADVRNAVRDVKARAASFEEIDARGQLVMPGFVDGHTHALFAGNRVADFEALAAGRRPELGMAYTIEQTRLCSREDLVEIGRRHLALMFSHGTTTAEVKSGYALTADGECKLLAAIAELGRAAELPRTVATFCGAHALPPEFHDFGAFVAELSERFLPQVVAQDIARFADAFCEPGFFSVAQSERFLSACAGKGLRLRIHADELAAGGGARLAARLGCTSADHLNFIENEDIGKLAQAGCIAVLCPGTVAHLGLPRFAPARALIDSGVPVALATDFNPGTCPCWSLQMIAYLARRHMRMSVPETIAALTITAAHSLNMAEAIGSIVPQKCADLLLLHISDYRELGYYFGSNLVASVFVGDKAR